MNSKLRTTSMIESPDEYNSRIHVIDGPFGQVFITARVMAPSGDNKELDWIYEQVSRILAERKLCVVHERILGRGDAASRVLNARECAFNTLHSTILIKPSYIEGHPCHDGPLAGVLIRAVLNDSIASDFSNPYINGTKWNDVAGDWIVLSHPLNKHIQIDSWDRKKLVASLLDSVQGILKDIHWDYTDIVRTWFYLSHILKWYDQFNVIRTEAYKRFGLIRTSSNSAGFSRLPASTGIGAFNRVNGIGTGDFLACVPHHSTRIEQLENISQKAAYKYGSAFSRGALIQRDGECLLELSGTAAIDSRGNSMCLADPVGQLDGTVQKIRALLAPLGGRIQDFLSSTVFIKRPEDYPVFCEYLQNNGLDDFPYVCVVGDICRDELLFEIDGALGFHLVK